MEYLLSLVIWRTAMNKQELIDELAKYVKRYENVMDDYSQGRYDAYKVSLKLMKRLNEPNITDEQAWNKISEAYPESAQCLRNTLDNAVFGNASEPQKPIVPQFVTDWFDKLRKQIVPYHFESGARFMMFIGRDFHHKKGLTLINEEIRQWLEKDGNEVILSNAIDYGYDVEKEQLYVVSLPGYNESMLVYDSVIEDYVIVDENFNDEFGVLRFELTEKEIKSKDERYWPFAAPAEEVEEG